MSMCMKVLHTWYFFSVCGKGEGTSSPPRFELLYPRRINYMSGGHLPVSPCTHPAWSLAASPGSPLMIQRSNEAQRGLGPIDLSAKVASRPQRAA